MSKQNKMIWAVLAGVAVLAALVLPPLLADDVGAFWEGMLGLAILFGAVVLYFVPTIVAARRKHHSMGGIIALNLLAGWTFIGWLIAFVWSLSDPSPTVRLQQQVAAPTQYQTGDVVNGYRFNGQDWTPTA